MHDLPNNPRVSLHLLDRLKFSFLVNIKAVPPLTRRILRRVSQRLAAIHNADHYNTVDMPKLFFYYSRKKIFDAAFIISLLKRSVIIMSKINSCGNNVIKMYKKNGYNCL